MRIITLTQDIFDETIRSHEITLVYFWARWSSMSMLFTRTIEKASLRHHDVLFAKVNIQGPEEIGLAQELDIATVPFIVIFKREFALFHLSGVQPTARLNEVIAQAKRVDVELLRQHIPASEVLLMDEPDEDDSIGNR